MNSDYSLIMSVYNNIKTYDLVQSIKSIGNQSHKSNDVIVIVDGFCKSSLIFNIKKYLDIYFKKKYKIIFNKKNMGIPFSYNRAIKLTKNNFVGISDADDISQYYRFKHQIKHLIKNKNIGIVGSYVKEIDDKNKTVYIKRVPINDKKIKIISNFKNPINHPTVVFNKKKFFKNLSYKNCYRMEDYYLWIRAMNENIKFSNIPEALVTTKINIDFYKRRSNFRIINSEIKIFKLLLISRKTIAILFFPIFLLKFIYHLLTPEAKPIIRNLVNLFLK